MTSLLRELHVDIWLKASQRLHIPEGGLSICDRNHGRKGLAET
jgi:hypothetical protein